MRPSPAGRCASRNVNVPSSAVVPSMPSLSPNHHPTSCTGAPASGALVSSSTTVPVTTSMASSAELATATRWFDSDVGVVGSLAATLAAGAAATTDPGPWSIAPGTVAPADQGETIQTSSAAAIATPPTASFCIAVISVTPASKDA